MTGVQTCALPIFCIGINEYYNLQSLKYAVQDAASIRDFFLQEGEFEQVYYFAEGAPPIETPRGPMRSQPTFGNQIGRASCRERV